MRLANYNEWRQQLGTPPAYAGTVVSVHGVFSTGRWQKEIAPLCSDAQVRHIAIDYGFVLPPTAALLQFRHLRRFVGRLKECLDEQGPFASPVHVVAHSFGTWLIGRALLRERDIVVGRVILSNGVLSRRHRWDQVVERGQALHVLNEGSSGDLVPFLGSMLWGGGWCGRGGCIQRNGIPAEYVVSGRSHSPSHHREHYLKVWLPFWLEGRIPR